MIRGDPTHQIGAPGHIWNSAHDVSVDVRQVGFAEGLWCYDQGYDQGDRMVSRASSETLGQNNE